MLTAKRDHYLPLRVIKDNLEALDRGEPLPSGTAGPVGVPPAAQAAAEDGPDGRTPPLTAALRSPLAAAR